MHVPGLMKKDKDFREVKACLFQRTHGICELMTILMFLYPPKPPEAPHSLYIPPKLLNPSLFPCLSPLRIVPGALNMLGK